VPLNDLRMEELNESPNESKNPRFLQTLNGLKMFSLNYAIIGLKVCLPPPPHTPTPGGLHVE
jgi:hypothetical protein